MDDIADGMLDGTMCQMCGVYIGEPGGYPVTCQDCIDEEGEEDDEKVWPTAKCGCGGVISREGVDIWTCKKCGVVHPITDDIWDDADEGEWNNGSR